MYGMSSYHSGGANILMGDGSVKFLKNSTANNVVWARARSIRVKSSTPAATEFRAARGEDISPRVCASSSLFRFQESLR